MLSKDESQIDAFRRDNRPSTAPLTINLIKRCLKGRGGREGLELMEYVAGEVEGGLQKERKRADDDLVDGERIGLTGREECAVMGRVTQVLFRWQELENTLEDMVGGAERAEEAWDVYGITNKKLFDEDRGGGLERMGVHDSSMEVCSDLYLINKITCCLALFVIQYERSVGEGEGVGMRLGVIDFLDSEVMGEMEAFVEGRKGG